MQRACSAAGAPAAGVRCCTANRPNKHTACRRRAAVPVRVWRGCRATESDESHQAAEEAYTPPPPKFLFDEDPPGQGGQAAGADMLAGNPAIAAALQRATARPSSTSEPPPPQPPPPPDQSAPEAAPDAAPSGPKFLFDELPEPASGGNGSANLLAGNSAFASILQGALSRRQASGSGDGEPQHRSSPPPSPQPAAAQQQPAAAPPPPPQPQPPAQRPQQPARPPPEEPMSAAEEVLHKALRDSRRSLLIMQRMHEELGTAMKREEAQFERIHFALQKARSDSARLRALQRMLDARGRQ